MSSGGAKARSHVASDEEFATLQEDTKKSSTSLQYIKTLPFAAISSFLCIILYLTVGGVEIQTQIPYVIVSYLIGVFGLTLSISNVNTWARQKKVASSSPLWFSVFYNNSFYVFLLVINSSVVCSSFRPTTSMILAQLISVFLPAWLSGMSLSSRK